MAAQRSNSTAPAAARQEDTHEEYSRYIVIPDFIDEQIETGVLTQGDAHLLAKIHSLAKKKGCWANNRYLAKKCGVKPRWIQYQIVKLIGLGLLVKQGGENGEPRYLFTDYDRWNAARLQVGNTPMHLSAPPMHVTAPPHARHCTQTTKSRLDVPKTRSARLRNVGTTGRKKVVNDTTDVKQAKRLHRLVCGPLMTKKEYSDDTWATPFRLLRSEVGEARVESVLSWYEKNARQEKFKVYSAKNFRAQFDVLEGKSLRDASHRESSEPVHPDTDAVFARIKDLTWEKGSKSQLRSAVNTSLNNVSSLVASLSRFIKQCEKKALTGKDQVFKRLAERVLGDLTPVRWCVRFYYEEQNEKLSKWEGWGGKLPVLRMGQNGRLLQRCRGIALDSARGEEWWDDLEAKLDL